MPTWYDYYSVANRLMRVNCAVLAVLMLILQPSEGLRAAETVVQNDALALGSEGAIQTGFEVNDIGASVLELPSGVDALNIQTIQLLFLSNPAHALHTFGNVHLYCGTLPDPGAPVRTVGGTGINPDYMNEIDVSGENWVVRPQDGPFAVGFEYLWKVGGSINTNSGHLVTDTDGCQPGKNMIYDAATSTWLDACSEGLPGDFVIRVVGEVIASKAPFGDADQDGDIDQEDFGLFQQCYGGQGMGVGPECAASFDCDRDGDVDLNDLLSFATCASGPGVPADPNCGTCLPATLCESDLLSKPSAGGSGKPSAPGFHPIWWILIIAAIIAAVVGIRGCYNATQIIAAQNAFLSAGRPSTSQERARIQEALVYLRDTLGATDSEAHRAGEFLLGGEYHTDCCKIQVVPPESDPKRFIATEKMQVIWISEEFLSWRYSREMLAMILFAEWCHIDDPGPFKEDVQQARLEAFRQRHSFQDLLPEMKHGAPEGSD